MTRDLQPFLRRIISLAVAGSAAALRAETLTSPDTSLAAASPTPFAAARAPLTPQDVMAAAATTRPRQFTTPRASAPSRQASLQGPLMIGGTTSATPIDPQSIGGRSESFRMEALLRDAAVKSVEPTAKFIWIQ